MFDQLAASKPTGGGSDSSYDEEQWQHSIEESQVAAPGGDDRLSRPGAAAATSPGEHRAAPSLSELLEKVPESSQELIDSLFRGRFIGVRAVDRKKLY